MGGRPAPEWTNARLIWARLGGESEARWDCEEGKCDVSRRAEAAHAGDFSIGAVAELDQRVDESHHLRHTSCTDSAVHRAGGARRGSASCVALAITASTTGCHWEYSHTDEPAHKRAPIRTDGFQQPMALTEQSPPSGRYLCHRQTSEPDQQCTGRGRCTRCGSALCAVLGWARFLAGDDRSADAREYACNHARADETTDRGPRRAGSGAERGTPDASYVNHRRG